MENPKNIAISIKDLHKTYSNKENEVLKGINLEIEAGQIIGYIGPNGAGKSTTVKVLCGILQDFDGDISILGIDIRKNPIEVKKRIGYIPENAALYDSLTPIEYLQFIGEIHKMPTEDIKHKSRRLLQLFEMDTHAHSRMNTFSKGMKQKILIISGIIHNPDVIFMDEPLSGLDANTMIIVKKLISQLAKDGKTIFYSSHIMDVVEKISDQIIIIDEGIVKAQGSYQELSKGEKDDSLEILFTKLTGKTNQEDTAKDIINLFND